MRCLQLLVVCFFAALPRAAAFYTHRHLPRNSGFSPGISRSADALYANVVITGSAGGVGYAYAEQFLAGGHSVVISDIVNVEAAVASLKKKFPSGNVYGTTCDVSDVPSVEALGAFAQEKLSTVSHWINNAGINGGRRALSTVPMAEVQKVVTVNLLGIIYSTKVAMDIMSKQPGGGHIFNTVGSGVKGGGTPGYACYGATKRGIPQFTKSLVEEVEKGVQGYEKEKALGRCIVHNLSPGMVFTQLLLKDSTPELRKFPFGVLAAQPEEVAIDLVPKILACDENSQGSSVEFLTPDRILNKFWGRFVKQEKSDYIDDDGNVIKFPEAEYDEDGVRRLF